MISSLQGVVEATGPDFVIVNVGGVGFHVFAPTSTLAELDGVGKQVRLHTHLHFKEDALALYGFATPDQLRLFLLLMNVSGIGPRNALRMLSVMSPMDLVAAIASDDIETLTRVPGIGRKTAARLSLELKGSLQKEWSVAPSGGVSPIDGDAVAALTALGYSAAEARSALASVDNPDALTIEERIAQALQSIGQR